MSILKKVIAEPKVLESAILLAKEIEDNFIIHEKRIAKEFKVYNEDDEDDEDESVNPGQLFEFLCESNEEEVAAKNKDYTGMDFNHDGFINIGARSDGVYLEIALPVLPGDVVDYTKQIFKNLRGSELKYLNIECEVSAFIFLTLPTEWYFNKKIMQDITYLCSLIFKTKSTT